MAESHGVMNNAKWEELRLAMHGIESAPRYRCMTISGCYSDANAEWFYHFRAGRYDDIRDVDIFVEGEAHRDQIRGALALLRPLRRVGKAKRAHHFELGMRIELVGTAQLRLCRPLRPNPKNPRRTLRIQLRVPV